MSAMSCVGSGKSDLARSVSDGEGEKAQAPSKRVKRADRLMTALESMPTSSHWSDHVFLESHEEPARGQLGKKPLLVLHFYVLTGQGTKIPGTTYDVKSQESVGAFVTKELGLGSGVGLTSMDNQAKGGSKWLIWLPPTSEERVRALGPSFQKLAKGVGFALYRLPVMGRITARVTATGVSPWMELEELEKGLRALNWVKDVSKLTRVKVATEKVVTEKVCMLLTPNPTRLVREGLTGGELLTLADWKVVEVIGGFRLLLHRTASCGFCGGDNHLIATCESLQRVTSDAMPTFDFSTSSPVVAVAVEPTVNVEPVAGPSKKKKPAKQGKAKKVSGKGK